MSEALDHPDERIQRLELQLRRQKLAIATLVLGVVALSLTAFAHHEPDIIRARGIVIEDAVGRERILIGAPIPYAANRIRTDSARARKAWAGRFPDPDAYMGYYRDYRHTMHGMLILDENGFDRVAVGDSTPDPNVGQRLGPATGIEINDDHGFERSGYGLLTIDGEDRVVLGLDGSQGEGVTLMLIDGEYMGLSIYGPEKTLGFFGSASPGNGRTQMADSLFGLLLRRDNDIKHVLNAAGN